MYMGVFVGGLTNSRRFFMRLGWCAKIMSKCCLPPHTPYFEYRESKNQGFRAERHTGGAGWGFGTGFFLFSGHNEHDQDDCLTDALSPMTPPMQPGRQVPSPLCQGLVVQLVGWMGNFHPKIWRRMLPEAEKSQQIGRTIGSPIFDQTSLPLTILHLDLSCGPKNTFLLVVVHLKSFGNPPKKSPTSSYTGTLLHSESQVGKVSRVSFDHLTVMC